MCYYYLFVYLSLFLNLQMIKKRQKVSFLYKSATSIFTPVANS